MKTHTYLFFIALFFITLPFALRLFHDNTTLPGYEPYYHFISSQELSLNPYHLTLFIFYSLFRDHAFWYFSALFALGSFFLFARLLSDYSFLPIFRNWILLCYALSPFLISISYLNTPRAFFLFFALLTIVLLRTRYWILGIFTGLLAAFVGFTYALLMMIILITLLLTKYPRTAVTAAILATSLAFVQPAYDLSEPAKATTLSDFGAIYGLSLFSLLLALIGFAFIWRYKVHYYSAYLFITSIVIYSFFQPALLLYTQLVVCILSGIALASLSLRIFELRFIKQATLLVLICGLLFSALSHAVTLADHPPRSAFFTALRLPSGTIFSDDRYGFWIEYAGHQALLDSLIAQQPSTSQLLWDSQALFDSTSIERAHYLISKYNITYILITPSMTSGLVWERPQLGLDFLIHNSETFKKIPTDSDIEVFST